MLEIALLTQARDIASRASTSIALHYQQRMIIQQMKYQLPFLP
jgi:hypothetical protein